MDSEDKKHEEQSVLTFEEQLAELIKQSGGSVPPKTKKPREDEPVILSNPRDEDEPIILTAPADEEPVVTVEKQPDFSKVGDNSSPEQESARLDAVLDGFADGDDTGFMDFGEPDFTQSGKSGGGSLDEIEEEIAELEKDISEAEIASLQQELEEQKKKAQEEKEQAAESYRLDYELERMLNALDDEAADISDSPAENGAASGSINADREPTKESVEKDAEIERLLRAEREKSEAQAQLEMRQMMDKIAALENMLAQKEKPQESADVIADENIEIVPSPQSHESSAEAEKVAAMEAKLDELLKEKKEPDPAAATEMEQMRAKIASLEYMLSQKPKESEEKPAAASTGIPTGDINTMFKQWFDLEMAAKMKTLILPEDKKKQNEAAQSAETDQSQGSDFIKLSDNVFYNVREKKTYVMKELTVTPSLPEARPKKKPKRRKSAAGGKGTPRKKRRPAPHGRAPRPRRPKPPAKRPKK